MTLVCFLPAWALSFQWSPESACRVIAAATAIWLFRWLYIFYSIWNLESRTPTAFRFSAVLNLGAFLAFAVCASGLAGRTQPLNLTGLLITIAHVDWTSLL